MVTIKRVYEPPSGTDGIRILVDRLWPRGVSKRAARIEAWMRELGPSDELRQFFAHDLARWLEFRRRYLAELRRPQAASMLDELRRMADRGRLTLVYGARDTEHNQAIVLKALLERNPRRKLIQRRERP